MCRDGLRIAVLGASQHQTDFISYAVQSGHEVHAFDNIPDNPGHRLAHRSHRISTIEHERICDVCTDLNIDGIVAPGTDVAVPTVAFVAERLELPGPSAFAAQAVIRKELAQRLYSDAGFRVPRSLDHEMSEGPWIVKPEKASGSKGVRLCRTVPERIAAEQIARRWSSTGNCLVQEYIAAPQHTAEGFVCDGKIVFMAVSDRFTAPEPFTATYGHRFPAMDEQRLLDLLRKPLESVFRQLQYQSGPFDCDFAAEGSDIWMFELGLRTGGNFIIPGLRIGYEIDLNDALLRFATGRPPNISPSGSRKNIFVVILGVKAAGKVAFEHQPDMDLLPSNSLLEFGFTVSCGADVEPHEDGRGCLGFGVLRADEFSCFSDARNELIRSFKLRVDRP